MTKEEKGILEEEIVSMQNAEAKIEQAAALILSTTYAVANKCIDDQSQVSALFGIVDIVEDVLKSLSGSLSRIDERFFSFTEEICKQQEMGVNE